MRNLFLGLMILLNSGIAIAQESNEILPDEGFTLHVLQPSQNKILNNSVSEKDKLMIQNLRELCDSDFTKNYLIQNIKNLQDENKELKKRLEEARTQNMFLEKTNIKCELDLKEEFWSRFIIGASTTFGAFAGSATCLYINNNQSK